MTRRVVVTGVGAVSPVGNTAESMWSALLEGKNGISEIPEWKEENWAGKPLPVHIAGQVKDFDPTDYVAKKDVRRMEPFIQYAVAAADQAWKAAGLPEKLEGEAAERAGTLVGVGIGGLTGIINSYKSLVEKGPRRVSPFFIPAIIGNLAPGHIAIRFGLKNANWTPTSACASGTHGIGEAFMQIREGRADLMVAGGAEAAIDPVSCAGFASMHALTRNPDVNSASRPFDKNRDGFVMGEGAGILILEELEAAKARGAKILAEIVGYGSTCDAFHITMPDPDGPTRAMQQALAMSGMNASDISYINAHGTSTPFNDKNETLAIKNVLGAHATDKLMVSSTKSMTGHLLGGAGGVEGVISALAIARGAVPPTINHETPDPECDLDVIPNTAREVAVDGVLSNSFGFGGTNAVLALRRFAG